jgi:hypothetical protein
MAGTAELKDLSRLLDDALALPPERRQTWLDSLTGADLRHRATLARLLAEAEEPPDSPLKLRPDAWAGRGGDC